MRIRERRKQLGLSQSELADSVGVEQSTVHRWETGKQEPSLGHLAKLAHALGISLEKLIGGQLSDFETDTQEILTPEDRPIYRLLTGKDDRAFCERVSEALAQGWRLYGSPSIAWDEEAGAMKAAQAVVWHEVEVIKR